MKQQAKPILRAIKADAARRDYEPDMINAYWPYIDEEQKLADKLGCTEEIWKDVCRLEERYQRLTLHHAEVTHYHYSFK